MKRLSAATLFIFWAAAAFGGNITPINSRHLIAIDLQPLEIVYFSGNGLMPSTRISGFNAATRVRRDKEQLELSVYSSDAGWVAFANFDSNLIESKFIASEDGYVSYLLKNGDAVKRGRFFADIADGQYIAEAADKTGDEYAEYPANNVFKPGVFDIVLARVSHRHGAFTLQVKFVGEITNPWKAPYAFSLQNIDVYVGHDTGEYPLLPGRDNNKQLSFKPQLIAQINGYNPEVKFNGTFVKGFKIYVSADKHSIFLVIPDTEINLNLDTKIYCSVSGYDGYAPNKIRNVKAQRDEWNFGSKANMGNIIDDAGN